MITRRIGSWLNPWPVRLTTVLMLSLSTHAGEATFPSRVKPFFDHYCVRCHNADKAKSGVRVDQLNSSFEEAHLQRWSAIDKQIRTKSMPPEEEPQPTTTEREDVATWIGRGLHLARARPTPRNGGARRLTVAQYRNTLRELLLLEDDVAASLPPDAISRDGFSNQNDTLQITPLLLEAYQEIAQTALDRCIVDPATKPEIQRFRVDLGRSINPHPCPDPLILGADGLLLDNADFVVSQPSTTKPFDFTPFVMRTRYRFIEGYAGNDTVRGWREYDSLYHAVFACMRGSRGYPKGQAYSTITNGLLLRPAIPSAEVFGVESTYGPKANFKISLRELPDHGRFRVTVTASKYADGLLLDPGDPPQNSDQAIEVTCNQNGIETQQTLSVGAPGLYQIDAYLTKRVTPTATKEGPKTPPPRPAAMAPADDPKELSLAVGDVIVTGSLTQPGFLVVRLPAGSIRLIANYCGADRLHRIVLTGLPRGHELARRFEAFEKRSPRLGVHLGLRRDCGSTLSPVGEVQTVDSLIPKAYVFEGAIRNFPSPEVEKDNVNYLAGVREIGVRHEYVAGRDTPRLLIRSVEFEGPYHDTWPPPPHRSIFVATKHPARSEAHAREIVRSFATRAYRRPITSAEEARLMSVFQSSYSGTSNFETSVRDALQVVLTSPQFLFLIENSRTPKPEPLSEHELASKLSYFLWNGPPDSTLLRLADAGNLRRRLAPELGRMLDHPRFLRFIEEFAAQWLALDKFQVLEPDRERFPKLTRDVRSHLKAEPAQWLLHMARRNLPLRELIESDHIVADDVVTAYYDLGNQPESGFQFVPVQHRRPELGGLLSQAAILAGLSDGRESNPVKRGAWIARRIVGEPPDDPPPNVPALKNETQGLPLRERLERHRNQPGCAQCHSKIDPWGVPLEEFDASGRRKPGTIDARSTLPDNTEVASANALKHYLAADRIDQVAFNVLRHLITYATGRSPSHADSTYLREHARALKADGYRFGDMIRFVVTSPMFLEK